MYYIGLDIGTSALKTTLMDARRSIVYENSYGYTILQPQEAGGKLTQTYGCRL
ncbi:MAG: hypothetical protein ACLRL6_15805 [Clostridium sp.]